MTCRAILLSIPLACSSIICVDGHADEPDLHALPEYADVLELHGEPASAQDRSLNLFFDNGSWHGYSLQRTPERRFGFAGPFVLEQGGIWAGTRFAGFELLDPADARPLAVQPQSVRSSALPGRLIQSGLYDELYVRHTLIFIDSSIAVAQIELRARAARRVAFAVHGEAALGEARHEPNGATVLTRLQGSPATMTTLLVGAPGRHRVDADQRAYQFIFDDVPLPAGETLRFFVVQACNLDGLAQIPEGLSAATLAAAFDANAKRWNDYLTRALSGQSPLLRTPRYRRVAVKAVETLMGNWRGARGDLRHEGLFPSYSNSDFHGFWAWDSWKHAAALARIAPDLARQQVRAMFDYQNEEGMVADVIYRDSKENNWRDTKPPLAAWAVWQIYEATRDRQFLVEMYPKLVKYHRWWYAQRDHDRDGLAEYGSTDGTRIAAAWESGMDNAVRFDQAMMLRNGEHAWSLNQESVDLNAYLYLEKGLLADIADVIGELRESAKLRSEARALSELLRARMFDRETGYFYDIEIDGGHPIRVMGPEGWIPLWVGAATQDQARAVARRLLDPGKFATHMPFPTLAADHPEFSPVKGYWRGPVWLDQAAFAVEALRRYGMQQEAAAMHRRLLDNAVGLTGNAPIFENYDPLTGIGVQSPNFSWSAAHYLLLFRR